MPIYEYACGGCGHEFETLVRSGIAPQCPSCQSTDLNKMLSVFATPGASSVAAPDIPSACGSCEHRRGPSACVMS